MSRRIGSAARNLSASCCAAQRRLISSPTIMPAAAAAAMTVLVKLALDDTWFGMGAMVGV